MSPENRKTRNTRARLALGALLLLALIAAWLLFHRPSATVPDATTRTAQGTTANEDPPFPPDDKRPPDVIPAGSLGPAQPFPPPAPPDPAYIACQQDRQARLEQAVAGLDPATSPKDALTHALMMRLVHRGQDPDGAVVRAFQAGMERWPNDLDLAWYRFYACRNNEACDADAALVPLRRLDRDNAATWFASMGIALDRKDMAAFRRDLANAAAARIYDSRLGTAFALVRPVLMAFPAANTCSTLLAKGDLPTAFARAPDAADIASSDADFVDFNLAFPRLHVVAQCDPGKQRLADDVKRDCRAALAHLARADLVMERTAALPPLIALATDAASRNALREEYRRTLWLRQFDGSPASDADFAWRKWAEGEINVLLARAIADKRWPPQPDWLPPDRRARRVIEGDAPPKP